jgi:hypothetical protein
MKSKGRRSRKRAPKSSNGVSEFNGNQITRVSFSDVWQPSWSASGSLQTFGISSSNSGLARLVGIGAFFEFYRFVSLNVKILPFTNANPTIFCVSYSNSIAGVTDITSFGEAVEQQPRVLSSANTTMIVPLRINKRVLLTTPERWFTYATGSTSYAPEQGRLHIVPKDTTTQEMFIMISGVIEYCRPSPTAGADLRKRVLSSKSDEKHVSGCRCSSCC